MKITGKDIDIICSNNMENMFLVSLISSDNILCIEDAEKTLEFIGEVENALKTSSISDDKKREFKKYLNRGKNILNKDIKRFKEEK